MLKAGGQRLFQAGKQEKQETEATIRTGSPIFDKYRLEKTSPGLMS